MSTFIVCAKTNVYNTIKLSLTTTCFGLFWPSSVVKCVLEVVLVLILNIDTD